jgi:polysaccharide biosynthesis/export protein
LIVRTSVAGLVLTLVIFHADVSWGQAQDTGSTGAQDCQAHPEAADCQQTSKSSPAAKSATPAGSEQPPNISPMPSAAPGAEETGEEAKPLRPSSLRPQPEPRSQPEPPPPPPTEFQLMVADSVGQRLPIYGASLFRQPPSTFAPLENVPVPADYVIGPGDELNVRLWGQLNVELRATVDRNGHVFVPKVGTIQVAGVHVSNLDGYFREQIERIYRNFELAVTLGKLRAIDVFFVGEARRPGSYTISSLSTLVNAIFAGGGPAPQGSMRHIQVKRDGQLVTDFDLYDLLLKGDKSKDVPLLPGDVIYIAPVGPQVAIAGSVNAPAIYELKDGRTSLSDAIELAGGLNTVADGSKATVERIDQRQVRSVAEFALDQSGRQQMVKDGDIIRILSIVPRFDNAVTLRGNVANPGRYPWHSGMKIRDLIPSKETLLTRSYWHSENALVTGAATQYEKPLESKADAGRLRTEVKLNAPEINWDYAAIQRLNPVDLSTTLIPFSLGKAVLEGDETNNMELRAGDIVTIFSQRDISVPIKRQTMLVRVEGEVRVPGIYKIQQGDTLREILERAGGLTENAYLYGTQFTRESARLEQQAALDRITTEMEAEIQQKSIANTRSNPDNAVAIAAQSASQQTLVQQLRAAKASGRVVLQLKPSANSLTAVPPVILEDADHVLVPPQSQMVSVVGSVYNQSSFLYRKGATVGDYIRASGGGNATADLRHVLLVRADGSVIGQTSVFKHFGESFTSIRVLPGDAIVIPAKLQSGGFSKALRDWALLASQASIAAAVIATH